EIFPGCHRWLAVSCLFVPTVFFWGSGIFKDTLTLASLGVATFCVFRIAGEGRFSANYVLGILLSFWVIYSIKIYILLCFVPAVLLWITARYVMQVRQIVARILMIPLALAMVIVLGFVAIERVAEDDPRYNLDKLAETAQ